MTDTTEFTDEGFWQKSKKYALTAGSEVMEKALWLYYAYQRPDTPVWAKTVIGGAIAYFILPIDAIPDVIPGLGYTDDLGALAAAIGVISGHIDENVRLQARVKMDDWFGDAKKEEAAA